MNVSTPTPETTVITLSRRNLLGLYSQLDEGRPTPQLARRIDGSNFIVVVEEDEQHYNSEDREERKRGRAGASGLGQSYDEAIPVYFDAEGNSGTLDEVQS